MGVDRGVASAKRVSNVLVLVDGVAWHPVLEGIDWVPENAVVHEGRLRDGTHRSGDHIVANGPLRSRYGPQWGLSIVDQLPALAAIYHGVPRTPNGPREEWRNMNLGPMLVVVALGGSIAVLALCYLAGVLVERLNNRPKLD